MVSGFTSCMSGMEKGGIRLLIIASDSAESSVEKLTRTAAKCGTLLRTFGTKESLSEMTGESGRGVFGITNESLAEAILKEIDQNGRNA